MEATALAQLRPSAAPRQHPVAQHRAAGQPHTQPQPQRSALCSLSFSSTAQGALSARPQALNLSSTALASPFPSSKGGQKATSGKEASRKGRLTVQCTSAEVDPVAGVALYNPKSYDVIIRDAAKSVDRALDAGYARMEVEFPALPTSISGYEGASDDFIDANIQLALFLAQQLRKSRGASCKLVFPDSVEKRRAARKFRTSLEMTEGISLGTLEEAGSGSTSFFGQLKSAFDFDLDFDARDEAVRWTSDAAPDVHILVNASATELKGVEEYVEKVVGGTPVILFNLELDTLRADLGLFGFPPRDLHYRFLAQFLPVFYIRPRDYSKSVAVAPFILNYSGCLLRQYPGPWQVMFKQTDGSYACVAEAPSRFTLQETKEELMRSLGLQEEEGSAMEFFRRGYKTSTWWEEETSLEKSTNWRF